MTPSLRETQLWMRAKISLAPGDVPAADVRLNRQGGASGEERLRVYVDGYLARLHESLTEVYEAVRFIVGQRAFGELSRAYASTHPSQEYNLSLAGRRLPEFLRDYPLTKRLPFLPDLAELEWRVCLAFHAEQFPAADLTRLFGVPEEVWPFLRLSFQPATAVVMSAWPILDLWNARKQPRESIDIQLEGRAQNVLIFREGLAVRCERLQQEAAVLMRTLLAGHSLGEALDAVVQEVAEAALPVGDWFAHWAQQGLVTRTDAGDTPA